MGAVWVAQDEALGREVAVKEVILPPAVDEGDRDEIFARMVREAQAAGQLRHPSIVSVHDVVTEQGRPWIVMELLRGRSLQDLLKAGEVLSPEQVARLGVELLGALAAAHAQGVQHRDVKPANVFLCEDGRTVLTDFGIARVEGQVTITRSGALVGSPGYIPPERVRGDRGGPLSDVWSLGATLYAAVEGRPPFHAASPVAVLHKVLTEEAPPPQRAGAALGSVLLRMLAPDPAERPDTETAARLLRTVADGGQVRLPPPPPRPIVPPRPPATLPSGPRRQRGTGIVVASGLAGIALVAALAWYGTVRDRPPPVAAGRVTAQTSPTAASPVAPQVTPTVEQGKFTKPLDFCTLLTDAQVGKVLPGRFRKGPSSDGDGCQWAADGAGVVLAPIKPFLGEKEYWETSPEEAHERFVSNRNRSRPSDSIIWMWTDIGMRGTMRLSSTEARTVKGIGEEAFAVDLSANATGTRVRSEVQFRVSNLIVSAEYADLNPARAGRVRENALTLARAAAKKLAGM